MAIDKDGDQRRHRCQSRTTDGTPVELHVCSRFPAENKSCENKSCENKSCILTFSCVPGRLSCAIPKKWLIESKRLF
jgi:hypothetical protein